MKKYSLVLWILLLIQACQNNEIKEPKSDQFNTMLDSITILSDTQKKSEAPFLFNNGQQIILNWTERDAHDKKKNKLKFSFFKPQDLTFDSIITVPVAQGLQMHAESMAKIGVKKDGTLLAVYRKKSKNDRSRFGGLMYYTISTDKGKTWSNAHRLVTDTTATSQSFYDIALLPNQNLGLTWLDSRSKRRGKTLYFGQTDTTNLFTIQKPIAFSTCECCRTELYVDDNGTIHAAYRNLIEPDEEGFDGYGTTEIRDMYYVQSVDTAQNFTKPIPISKDNWHIFGCPHTGPSLAYNGQKLGAIWFTGAHNQSGLYFTTKTDSLAFKPRKPISSEGYHPQMIALGGKFYAVYEEYYEQNGKGYYRIILDIINADGNHKIYEISNPLTHNNHPVITPIDADKILVVWVNTDTRHPKIVYQSIDIHQLKNKKQIVEE